MPSKREREKKNLYNYWNGCGFEIFLQINLVIMFVLVNMSILSSMSQ